MKHYSIRKGVLSPQIISLFQLTCRLGKPEGDRLGIEDGSPDGLDDGSDVGRIDGTLLGPPLGFSDGKADGYNHIQKKYFERSLRITILQINEDDSIT